MPAEGASRGFGNGLQIGLVSAVLAGQPSYFEAYLLLAGIYEEQGKKEEAEKVYNKALAIERAPEGFRNLVRMKLEDLKK